MNINPNTFLNNRITRLLGKGGNPGNIINVPNPSRPLFQGRSLGSSVPVLPDGPNAFNDPITRFVNKTVTGVRGAVKPLTNPNNIYAAKSGVANYFQRAYNTSMDNIRGTGYPRTTPLKGSTSGISGVKSGIAGALLGVGVDKYVMPEVAKFGRYIGLSEEGLLGKMFPQEDRLRLRRKQGETGSFPPLYKKTEQEMGKAADKHRPGAGFSSANVPISTQLPSPRVNEDGVVQTQHGSGLTQQSISQINNSLGVTVQNPFSSVALPITEQGYLQFNESMPKGDSGYPEGYDQLLARGGAVEWSSDDVNNPANSPGKVVSTGNNGVLVGEDGLPVNNPFLSYEGPGGSMGALRAKEAASGIIHAAGGERDGISGSKWLLTGTGEDEKYVPISNENAQILMGGGAPAQQFLDNWKTKVTPSPEETMGGVDTSSFSPEDLKRWEAAKAQEVALYNSNNPGLW